MKQKRPGHAMDAQSSCKVAGSQSEPLQGYTAQRHHPSLSIDLHVYLYMHAFNLLAVVAAGFEIPTPRQSPKTADAGRLPPASWRRAVTMQSRSQL